MEKNKSGASREPLRKEVMKERSASSRWEASVDMLRKSK